MVDDVRGQVEELARAEMLAPPLELTRAIVCSRDVVTTLLEGVDRVGKRAHTRVAVVLAPSMSPSSFAPILTRVAHLVERVAEGGWPSRKSLIHGGGVGIEPAKLT